MAEDYEDDDDYEEAPRSGRGPRLGSFVTIAAAMLLLFGAASNVGRVSEVNSLFNIDAVQEKRAAGERLQDERLKTIITLGAVPVPVERLRPQSGSVPMDSDVLPPRRLNQDDTPLRPTVSMPRPNSLRPDDQPRVDAYYYGDENERDDYPPLNSGRQTRFYVVKNGDTWVKIAKETMGNASRWQDLVKANPSAKAGLQVGMRLTIP